MGHAGMEAALQLCRRRGIASGEDFHQRAHRITEMRLALLRHPLRQHGGASRCLGDGRACDQQRMIEHELGWHGGDSIGVHKQHHIVEGAQG